VREIVVPSSWRDRFEDVIGDRRDALLTAAVLVGSVVIGMLFWMRGEPPKIAPPATASSPVAAESTGTILVHVAGAVRAPGLYELPEGARVADAIEAAGGGRRAADLDLLNLAETLVVGTKVEVLRRGASPAPTSTGATGSAPAAGVVNVNNADAIMLETIPGIGPVTAAAIIAHRDASGPFESVEELLDVQGIGPATLESLRAYVTV
jgi:competence protein ComEA